MKIKKSSSKPTFKVNNNISDKTIQQIKNKFKENKDGEGYLFTKNRYDKIITIPSCFVLIAITHKNNITGLNRSYESFKDIKNKFDLLNLSERDIYKHYKSLFILDKNNTYFF